MASIYLLNFLGPEMLVILVVVLLLFGGKKIPQLMKGLGQGIKEFKSASKETDSDSKEGANNDNKEDK